MAIPHVVEGQLIQSVWGNAVADQVNTNVTDIDALEAGMTGLAMVKPKAWSVANGMATELSAVMGGTGTNWGASMTGTGWAAKANGIGFGAFRITGAGANLSPGTGNWRIALPYPAAFFSGGNPIPVGDGFVLNQGSVFVPVVVALASATQAEMYYPGTWGGPIIAVTGTAPFTFASGCTAGIKLTYALA